MKSQQDDITYLQDCLALACENVQKGDGGPFAALVVLDGEIIGRSGNKVTLLKDPTAHAEVEAIRDACRTVQHFRLEGATLYSSCEPCPMCLGAVYWAGISRVVFAADRNDAAHAGFNDAMLYSEVGKPFQQRTVKFEKITLEAFYEPFKCWERFPDRTLY